MSKRSPLRRLALEGLQRLSKNIQIKLPNSRIVKEAEKINDGEITIGQGVSNVVSNIGRGIGDAISSIGSWFSDSRLKTDIEPLHEAEVADEMSEMAFFIKEIRERT